MELLRRANGGLIGDGYWRLFGLGAGAIDLVQWNDRETWLFAWPAEIQPLLMFAHTVFGDQLGYRRDGSPGIFRVDAEDGAVEQVALSFEELVATHWLAEVGDERWAEISRRLGAIPADALLAYVPSPLLGGPMRIERLVKMNARAAMITRGDIIRQVRAAPPGARVERLEPYVDELRRGRMRLVLSR